MLKTYIQEASFRCPRTETVGELAQILEEQPVVLVRGTPAPGKKKVPWPIFYSVTTSRVRVQILNSDSIEYTVNGLMARAVAE